MNSYRQIHLFALFLLAVLCYCVFFYGLGSYPLWDPDEGRSGVIAKEMLKSGNWLTLTHNGAPYYDKPALYFWLVGLGSKLFALSEFTVRLPSALAATLAVGIIYLWGSLSGDWKRGLWGGAILATSIEFMALGRFGKMDMVFTFFFTASLLYFLWWKEVREGKAWIWPFYLLLALATLTKGPVGLLLPLLIVGVALGVAGKWALLHELRLLRGMAVFAIVSGAWFVPAALSDPSYIRTFLWEHNVLRFFTVTDGISHAQPAYFFVPVLIGGFLPWSLLLLPVLHRSWERRRGREDEGNLFLAIWAATVLIFFSLSRNKLGTYILPAFPPLALLTADTLREFADGMRAKKWKQRWTLYGCVFWLLLLFAGLPVSEWLFKPRYPQYFTTELPYAFPSLFLFIAGIVWALKKEKWIPVIVCFSLIWLAFWFYGVKVQEISESRSARSLALVVNKSEEKNLRIASIRSESFPFYVSHPVEDVAHPRMAATLLEEPVPTVILVKEKHIAEIAALSPVKFHVWKRIPSGNALVANFPRPAAHDLSNPPNP